MPRYRCTGTVVGGKYLGEFEAATPEEAREMALNSDAGGVSFCHQCSEQCEDPEVVEIYAEEIEDEEPKRKRKGGKK